MHVCALALTDAEALTPSTVDDMTPQCVTLGSNFEVVVQRRDGIPVPEKTWAQFTETAASLGLTWD